MNTELFVPAAAAASGGIEETMTLNHIVLAFPETRPVFDRLFINLPLEGCACLDEVAWRHGMEPKDLIEKLESAIRLRGNSAGWQRREPAKEGVHECHVHALEGSRAAA